MWRSLSAQISPGQAADISRAIFGVSAQQALTTRFDKYTPGSGLQSGGIIPT
ncbi:hypothetical protein GQY17_27640 (plasmid) [Klebsiella pneumoniae]|nr:hypothetical protein GQY17_27640 [Klebsiella pneumoniae]